MRRLAILAALLISAAPWAAQAQLVNPGMTLDGVLSVMPQPNTAVPQAEAVGGAVGSALTYLRSDVKTPRITRAATVTTIAGGTFSGTWATALSAAPNIVLTPIATGGVAVTCELTAMPTTTAFAGRCWTSQSTLLSLSIVTAGLTVAPNAASAAGISVQVLAIPPTQ